jgi:hypothetical protein
MKKIIFSLFIITSLVSCNHDDIILNDNEALPVAKEQKNINKNFLKFDAPRIVKRYFSSQKKKHYYGVDTKPIGSEPNQFQWVLEGDSFNLYPNYNNGGPAVYSLVNPNSSNLDNLLTTNADEIQNAKNQGYIVTEILGYASPQGQPNTFPVYRYYNPSKNDHFYTADWNELGSGSQGYNYEGIAFNLPTFW